MLKKFLLLDRYENDNIPLFSTVFYTDDYWVKKEVKILIKFKYFYLVFN